MQYGVLAGLEPYEFFYWFEQISRFPRGSGNEEKISKFVYDFAITRGFEATRDEFGNVFFTVPASTDYEKEAPILLQAHLDMVCAKKEGFEFDFQNEPIQLMIKDGRLFANGTTLGADNGKGVAVMLAIANDPSIPHPMLEMLFTTEEETGMCGIKGFDMTKITARRMINGDCGASHKICISSVGAIQYRVSNKFETEALSNHEALCLKVRGGLGGHGGTMIHLNRACAVNVTGALLSAVKEEIRLISFKALGAAIHPISDCVFAVEKTDKEAVIQKLKNAFATLYKHYAESDSGLEIIIENAKKEKAILKENSANVIDLFCLLPTKDLRRQGDIIITSNSISETILENGDFSLYGGVRSMYEQEFISTFEAYQDKIQELGFKVERLDGYSAWPMSENSKMQEKFKAAHKELFGFEIETQHIHGGIEVGQILKAIPDMDAVGIGTTTSGSHTPNETLYIDEVAPYWQLMLKVLSTKG